MFGTRESRFALLSFLSAFINRVEMKGGCACAIQWQFVFTFWNPTCPAADWTFLLSFRFLPQLLVFYHKTPTYPFHSLHFCTQNFFPFVISNILIQWLLLLLQISHQSCSWSLFCLGPWWLLLLVTCTKILISLGVMAELRSSTMDSFSLSPLTKPLGLASSPRMSICLGRLICSWSLCLETQLALSLPTM